MLPRPLRIAAVVLAAVLVAFAGLWGCLALFYQASGGPVMAALWGLLTLAAFALIVLRRRPLRTAGIYAVLFAALLFWWQTVLPSNDRDWADDVAEMTTGTVNGEHVTLSNVRNFRWDSTTDYTAAWESRDYALDQLASVDLILSYWSGPAIAHTLVSFGFADGQFVTFSVEIRKERTEAFSEIGGFFKEFETSVVAADERDIVYLRTNVRKEDVYLYRIRMPAAAMRSLFLAYVEEANGLAREPRFYNTVTANCTTIVYKMMNRIVPGLPLDYRLLFSGYLPDYIAEVGGFTPGVPLDELKKRGAISLRGQEAGNSNDFSRLIRKGIPGIGN